ncbi:hypothetical protein B0H16DRAFT_659209 [Mycena metata]|uniref:Uncharacterized protein n=1 Tax=Mycena metata TaxID=1033252 RepID=A0AAD7J6J4_9AGAR|nr:hypothetical protein B0H16DRAFT_659209 [Mycena metata]
MGSRASLAKTFTLFGCGGRVSGLGRIIFPHAYLWTHIYIIFEFLISIHSLSLRSRFTNYFSYLAGILMGGSIGVCFLLYFASWIAKKRFLLSATSRFEEIFGFKAWYNNNKRYFPALDRLFPADLAPLRVALAGLVGFLLPCAINSAKHRCTNALSTLHASCRCLFMTSLRGPSNSPHAGQGCVTPRWAVS